MYKSCYCWFRDTALSHSPGSFQGLRATGCSRRSFRDLVEQYCTRSLDPASVRIHKSNSDWHRLHKRSLFMSCGACGDLFSPMGCPPSTTRHPIPEFGSRTHALFPRLERRPPRTRKRPSSVKKSPVLGIGGLSPLLHPLPRTGPNSASGWCGRDAMSRARSTCLHHGNRCTWAIHWLSKDEVFPESNVNQYLQPAGRAPGTQRGELKAACGVTPG